MYIGPAEIEYVVYRIYSISTRAYYSKTSKKIGLREVIWVRDLLNDVCWEATFIQITRARTIRTRKIFSFGVDYWKNSNSIWTCKSDQFEI